MAHAAPSRTTLGDTNTNGANAGAGVALSGSSVAASAASGAIVSSSAAIDLLSAADGSLISLSARGKEALVASNSTSSGPISSVVAAIKRKTASAANSISLNVRGKGFSTTALSSSQATSAATTSSTSEKLDVENIHLSMVKQPSAAQSITLPVASSTNNNVHSLPAPAPAPTSTVTAPAVSATIAAAAAVARSRYAPVANVGVGSNTAKLAPTLDQRQQHQHQHQQLQQQQSTAASAAVDSRAAVVLPSSSTVRNDAKRDQTNILQHPSYTRSSGTTDSVVPAYGDVRATDSYDAISGTSTFAQTTSTSRKRPLQSEELAVKRVREDNRTQIPPLDIEDLEDAGMCAEYAQEIMEYLFERERVFMPEADYITLHPELKWNMRTVLVDWIIEVHFRFKFLPETLFLGINIMDRVLSYRTCEASRLQLLGLTALFIAAKTEEVFSPPVSQFAYMVEDSLSVNSVIEAEQYILRVLNYVFWAPGPFSFIRRISKVDDYNYQHRTLGKYFCELSLLDYRFLPHPPSKIAAAGMWLARAVSGVFGWNSMFVYASGYKEGELMDVVRLMIDFVERRHDAETFFSQKYASKRFNRAIHSISQLAVDFQAARASNIPPHIYLHKAGNNVHSPPPPPLPQVNGVYDPVQCRNGDFPVDFKANPSNFQGRTVRARPHEQVGSKSVVSNNCAPGVVPSIAVGGGGGGGGGKQAPAAPSAHTNSAAIAAPASVGNMGQSHLVTIGIQENKNFMQLPQSEAESKRSNSVTVTVAAPGSSTQNANKPAAVTTQISVNMPPGNASTAELSKATTSTTTTVVTSAAPAVAAGSATSAAELSTNSA